MPETRNDLKPTATSQAARDASLTPSVGANPNVWEAAGWVSVANTPAIALTTVAVTNPFGRAVVYIAGGTTTVITVDGTASGLTTTPATVIVEQGGTIAITYSVAPTWKWYLLP